MPLGTPPLPAVDPAPAQPPSAAGKAALPPSKVESLPSSTTPPKPDDPLYSTAVRLSAVVVLPAVTLLPLDAAAGCAARSARAAPPTTPAAAAPSALPSTRRVTVPSGRSGPLPRAP